MEPAAQVQPRQRAVRQVQSARNLPVTLGVQPPDLVLNLSVVRHLLERALQMPDRLIQRAVLAVALADPNMCEEVVGVGAEHTLEQIERVLVILLIEQRTSQQLVDFDIAGVACEHMAALRHDLGVCVALEAVFNVFDV